MTSLCPLQHRRVNSKGAPGLAFETWDPSNRFPLETPSLLFVIGSVVERSAVRFPDSRSGFGGEVALLGAHYVAGVEGYQVNGAEGSVQLEVGGAVG